MGYRVVSVGLINYLHCDRTFRALKICIHLFIQGKGHNLLVHILTRYWNVPDPFNSSGVAIFHSHMRNSMKVENRIPIRELVIGLARIVFTGV